MKHYPEYKDSGVSWIGKIPKHWEVLRSKHLFGNRNQRGSEGEPLLSVTQDQGILPRNELDYRVWNPAGNVKLYKLVRPGDWVISLRTFEGGIELSEVRGIVSAAYTTMFPQRQIFNLYFKYLLKSMNFIAELNRITTGIRQGKNISYEDFSDTRIVFPALSEQKAIGNFLNRKTRQIDELIRIKERRIELLQEQRTALINQAVTKGLVPNVDMKPSGVEWIGEIPKDWEVKRIKYLASLISKGTTPTTIGREILDEGKIRFIKAENIVDNRIELQPEYYIDEQTNQLLKRSQLKENDLLFVIAGATIGKVSLVKPNHLPANTNQAVSFIRPYKKELPEFIYYWLQSDNIQKMIWLEAVQSAQPNLSMEDLGNLHIPYPSIAEQHRIVDYIADKTQNIVQLLQQAYQQIVLLKEYRQSLISEAVTGKIDVRNEV